MGNLDLDFAALLVALSVFTGVVWAVDHWFFARARLARNPEAREPVLVEYCRSFFPVIFAVLVIRSFLAEPFRIPSGSMMPTLLTGDFILVNKFAYGIRIPVVNRKLIEIGAPARGDVIVFRYPVDPSTDYIKRVIGVPGDVIEYRGRQLSVNGQPVAREPLGRYVGEGASAYMTGADRLLERLPERAHEILELPGTRGQRVPEGRWTVPAGHFFVLGDNRDNSQDSRVWGFVPEENLVGKAFMIWMNWDFKAGGIDFGRIGNLID